MEVLESVFGGVAVAAIEMSQTEVEDFRLDIFGAGRVDRLSQLLHEEIDELGPGPLEVFAKCLRA